MNGKSFSCFLKTVVLVKKTRKELLSSLQLSFEVFGHLDAITLSRWANGATIPSLYKQILVAVCSDCLEQYINECEDTKITVSSKKNFKDLVKRLDSTYFQWFTPLYQKKNIYLQESNGGRGHKCLEPYIHKSDFLSRMFENSTSSNKPISTKALYISGEPESNASSAILFTHDVNRVLERIGVEFEEKLGGNALLVMLNLFDSSKSYETLYGLLGNYIIQEKKVPEFLFATALGKEGVFWMDTIGAKKIYTFENLIAGENFYLYYIEDFYTILAIPEYLQLIRNYKMAFQSRIINPEYITFPLAE